MTRTFSTTELMNRTRATEGQIHRWVHSGIVKTVAPVSGSGDRRRYDTDAALVTGVLGALYGTLDPRHERVRTRVAFRAAAEAVPRADHARGHVLACDGDGWHVLVTTDVPEFMQQAVYSCVVVLDPILDRLEGA